MVGRKKGASSSWVGFLLEFFEWDWIFSKVSGLDGDLGVCVACCVLVDLVLVSSPFRLGIYQFSGIDSLPFAKEELLQSDFISLDRVWWTEIIHGSKKENSSYCWSF
jgi:hypothetical protein